MGALDAEATARLETARATPPGLARHAALIAALIAAAEAVCARSDSDFAACGRDRSVPEVEVGMAALVRLARAVRISWRTRFRRTPVPAGLTPTADATPVTTKPAEGFAFYALYPEAVLDAADALGSAPDLAIVGVRAIGVALAALAAASVGARRVPVTVRPIGPPFARELAVDPARAGHVAGATCALVVDEGPGLSGSSFAAAIDWLGEHGISTGHIHLLASHTGPPGAMATERTLGLFRACGRSNADFERSVAPRLPAWAVEILGEPITDWRDISGGNWANGQTPNDPPRERRKYLATTAGGRFLVKFAGLGAVGEAKLARARALAGLVPPPAGLVHGFLVERWIDGCSAKPTLSEVAAYLASRARLPEGPGASLAELTAMARANVAESLGPRAAANLAARVRSQVRLPSRAVAIDGRLHAWEWVRDAAGRLWKTDALDHCEAHDLVGHQDIAWDVAGASVELGLDPAGLARRVGADLRLVALHGLLYPAFQLGLWTMAGHTRADFYAERLRSVLTPVGPPPASAGR